MNFTTHCTLGLSFVFFVKVEIDLQLLVIFEKKIKKTQLLYIFSVWTCFTEFKRNHNSSKQDQEELFEMARTIEVRLHNR